jgi:lipopolysaccharide/colanic/teichoic acid biosynthesis glycosyltransferase
MNKNKPLDVLLYANRIKRRSIIIYHVQEDVQEAKVFLKFIIEHINKKPLILVITEKISEKADFQFEGIDKIFHLKSNRSKMRYKFKKDEDHQFKLPLWKRAVDIVFSVMAILALLPLFILVIVAIRAESRGKVIYAAPRVGAGYRIFNFYKFRSMYTNADKKVDMLSSQNQYLNEERTGPLLAPQLEADQGDPMLIDDDSALPESVVLEKKKQKQENAFFKMVNDPRITKVGRLLRKTSIDELPQLFNILLGDMSVVGNRPLPLYEAENLTEDRWAERFLAPAGLTGLWQVTKRGGANKMSADERKQLDIDYARNFSFWGDIRIILKTFPSILQHENV